MAYTGISSLHSKRSYRFRNGVDLRKSLRHFVDKSEHAEYDGEEVM